MASVLGSKEVAVFRSTAPSKSWDRNGTDFLKGRLGELWYGTAGWGRNGA